MRQDLHADGCSMSCASKTMNLHFFQTMCNYRQFVFSFFHFFSMSKISNQAASTTARQMKAVLIRAIQGKDPFWSHAANMSTGSGSRCHQVSLVISTTLMGKIPLRHHAPI